MSTLRSYNDDKTLQKVKSIDLILKPENQSNRYLLNRRNRSKNRYNNHSLHSLQVNKNSINILDKMKSNRRRLVIQPSNQQHKELMSERPYYPSKEYLNNNHKNSSRVKKIEEEEVNRYMSLQNHKANQFIMSIDQLPLNQKEKKIQNCIELMQGVLENIKIEKSRGRGNKSNRKFINLEMGEEVKQEQQPNKQKSVSQFQKYVRNVCSLKQENGKPIIVKINKNKSYNRQNIRSSALLNLQKFQTLTNTQKPKQIKPYDPLSAKKRKPYFDNLQNDKKTIKPSLIVDPKHCQTKPLKQLYNKNLEDMDVSVIKKVNESSFISSNGRQSLIKHLEDQSKEKQTMAQSNANNNNKIILKIKNHRKLKNMFPCDFF